MHYVYMNIEYVFMGFNYELDGNKVGIEMIGRHLDKILFHIKNREDPKPSLFSIC